MVPLVAEHKHGHAGGVRGQVSPALVSGGELGGERPVGWLVLRGAVGGLEGWLVQRLVLVRVLLVRPVHLIGVFRFGAEVLIAVLVVPGIVPGVVPGVLVLVVFVCQIVTRRQSCPSCQQLLDLPGLGWEFHQSDGVETLVLHDPLLQPALVVLLLAVRLWMVVVVLLLGVLRTIAVLLLVWIVVVLLLGGMLIVLKVLTMRGVGLDIIQRARSIVGVVLLVLSGVVVCSWVVVECWVSVVGVVVLAVARPVVVAGAGGGRAGFVPVVLDEREAGTSSQGSSQQLDAAHIAQPDLGGHGRQPLNLVRLAVDLGGAQHRQQRDLDIVMRLQ